MLIATMADVSLSSLTDLLTAFLELEAMLL